MNKPLNYRIFDNTTGDYVEISNFEKLFAPNYCITPEGKVLRIVHGQDIIFLDITNKVTIEYSIDAQDINGNIMYEGDTIVDWNTGIECVHTKPYTICKNNRSFILNNINNGFSMYEIIGNMHR